MKKRTFESRQHTPEQQKQIDDWLADNEPVRLPSYVPMTAAPETHTRKPRKQRSAEDKQRSLQNRLHKEFLLTQEVKRAASDFKLAKTLADQ